MRLYDRLKPDLNLPNKLLAKNKKSLPKIQYSPITFTFNQCNLLLLF